MASAVKLLKHIAAWFKKKPIQHQDAGQVFRPIFRKATSGTKIKNALDNG